MGEQNLSASSKTKVEFDQQRQHVEYQINIGSYHGTGFEKLKETHPEIKQELNIKTNVIAAYFNRTSIFPKIISKLSRAPLAKIFLFGKESDWLAGLSIRLKNELAESNTGKKSKKVIRIFEITWPVADDLEDLKHIYWEQVYRELSGESQSGEQTPELLIKKIATQLKRLCGSASESQCVFCFHIPARHWSEIDEVLLCESLSDWEWIQQEALGMKSKKRIGLIHFRTEYAPLLREDKLCCHRLKALQAEAPDKQSKKMEAHENVLCGKSIQNALIEKLGVVKANDIDDWYEKVRKIYGSSIRDESWWLRLKNVMRKQFTFMSKTMRHKQLKNKLEQSEAFIQILNISRNGGAQ